jgi:DNA-binding transcriptional LysR family regulator
MTRTVRNTNVNLLVALDALLEEKNVTRAAARAGVTQSSMSASLAQLRTILNDPLLVRSGRTMRTTPLADRIAVDLRRGIDAFAAVLAGGRTFDPRTSEERFVLALSDRVEAVLFPRLVARMRVAAPGVTVQVVPWGHPSPPPELGSGEVDVSVSITVHDADRVAGWNHAPPVLGSGFHSARLFESELASIVRRDHPAVGAELTLDTFCGLEHVLVTEKLGHTGIVDHVLSGLGRQRRIAVRVPRHTLVGELIAATDLVATIDRRVAEELGERCGLRVFRPPVDLPRADISMVWHERTEADAARRWLREQVREVAAPMAG